MKLIFIIIVFHLLAILIGRNDNITGFWSIVIVIALTLLMLCMVLYGLFNTNTPDLTI